jgi:hypothetical protein
LATPPSRMNRSSTTSRTFSARPIRTDGSGQQSLRHSLAPLGRVHNKKAAPPFAGRCAARFGSDSHRPGATRGKHRCSGAWYQEPRRATTLRNSPKSVKVKRIEDSAS